MVRRAADAPDTRRLPPSAPAQVEDRQASESAGAATRRTGPSNARSRRRLVNGRAASSGPPPFNGRPPRGSTTGLSVGDLVAGQHRLLRVVRRSGGAELWQAVDENLARQVAVQIQAGSPADTEPLLVAAARAGRVGNPRLARVYDAGQEDGYAYVVREWVPGTPLDRLLADGPMPADQATDAAAAVALAVASAHEAGCPHRRLRPGSVVLTDEGRIVLVDLATAAAVAGPAPAGEPALADTRAIGALYYALLTGRWPLDPPTSLPPAPWQDGRLCPPAQVRGGVPRQAGDLVARLLAPDLDPKEPPLVSPRAAARALSTPASDPAVVDPGVEAVPAARTGRVLVRLLIVAVLLGAAALVGWQIGLRVGALPASRPDFGALGPVQPAPEAGAQVGQAAQLPIPVVTVRDFDPQGDGHEDTRDVANVIDGDPSTTWATDTYYGSPALGGTKAGVGLLLDLGAATTVSSVEVDFTAPGNVVELRAADTAGGSADAYRVVATAGSSDRPASATATLRPETPVASRYLLVWITRLAPVSGGYRATIRDITVTGSVGVTAPADGAAPASPASGPRSNP